MGTAAILGGLMAYTAYFHGDALSMIFVRDAAAGQADVIRDSAEFLRATSIECFVLSVAYCLTGYFNGLGRTAFVMAQGLCAILLVKLPYACLASRRPEPELFDIGLSTAYAALFTLAACLGYYLYIRRRGAASGKSSRSGQSSAPAGMISLHKGISGLAPDLKPSCRQSVSSDLSGYCRFRKARKWRAALLAGGGVFTAAPSRRYSGSASGSARTCPS